MPFVTEVLLTSSRLPPDDSFSRDPALTLSSEDDDDLPSSFARCAPANFFLSAEGQAQNQNFSIKQGTSMDQEMYIKGWIKVNIDCEICQIWFRNMLVGTNIYRTLFAIDKCSFKFENVRQAK